MDLDRVARETSSTPALSTTTSSTSATATSAAESNSATQDALVDVGGVEAAEPASSTLSGRQVGVLANFGIGPENLDDEAQARMAHAIGRLDGMLSCTGDDEAACAALGPAPISLSDASSADGNEQEILLEEADYTLTLRVSTDPLTGETTSRLLYVDVDGTYISGLSNQPVETLFAPEPTPEAEAAGEVAADASPDEKTWLNTLADLDADYHVLARLGGAMQAYGAASDLAVAVPLLLAPEPTMLTKVAAAGAGLRGLDDLQAGVRTLISGEPTETVTQTLATDVAIALGADPEAAKTIGLGADMVTGLLNPAGRLRNMTTEASERLAMQAAEQAGRHGDDAADLARKLPTPDQVRGGCPIPVPADAAVTVETKAAGYDQIRFRWDDGTARYDARWHTRTPGAPVDQGDTWVIERKTHGTPTGQQKALHILLADGRWVSKQSWQEAIAARKAGTATAEQEAMLAAGHHPTN